MLEPAFTKYDALSYYRVYDVTEHLPAEARLRWAWRWATAGTTVSPRTRGTSVRQAGVRCPSCCVSCISHTPRYTGLHLQRWKTSPGPITFNSIRNGEWYDARLELPGWSESTYGADGWQDAELVRGAGGVLRAAEMQPIRVMQELAPVNAYRTQEGRWIFDLGQNFAGKVRLTAMAPQAARLCCATART